jgi:hypothetical protein
MSYAALVEHFSAIDSFPVDYGDVIDWVIENTDHKIIKLYPVAREKKAYRGAFRRRAYPSVLPYATDPDIQTDILYGQDLTRDWKNLVITKEVLHVFDPDVMRVNTPEAAQKLIPAVIHVEVQRTIMPELHADLFAAIRALPILIPMKARADLKDAVASNHKTIEEVAGFVDVPPQYVDLWLEHGEQLFDSCLRY